MGLPADHTALLQRTGFPVPATGEFDEQERSLLSRYGYWMEALAGGKLALITPEQQRFVRVAQGAEEPLSAFELVWEKYRLTVDPARPRVGPMELAERLERVRVARAAAVAVQEEYAARRDAIIAQVRPQLEALEAEYTDRLRATGEEATRLQDEAREEVLLFGASFKHAGVYAVYARGRVTWDTKGLTRYMEAHPEVAEFRRVGEPSVSLRFL
jgi:uncharacterized protein YifE (UPF0438 family)